MNGMDTFFSMGGYAAYVWPAIGLTLVVLIGFVITTLRRLRRTRRALSAVEAALSARRAGRRRDRGKTAAGGGR